MIEKADHERFARLIAEPKNLILTTHMNPDGDALGSEIGLARFLRSRGHKVRLLNTDPVPESLDFLMQDEPPVTHFQPEEGRRLLAEADHVLLVDNSAPDRLARMEEPMLEVAEKTCCIDHHPNRGTPWGEMILNVGASATCEIVHELITGQGYQPDLVAARALYVGIATDTGFFRFNSTTSLAHEIAASLIAGGVNTAECYRRIYERNTQAFMQLLGYALSRLKVEEGGAVAAVSLSSEAIHSFRAEDEDVSEITNFMLSIDGVKIALLFRELAGDKVKVSLRSKGSMDVHSLAILYGGGGHRNASGIVTDGLLRDVAESIVGQAQRMSRGEAIS